MVANEVYDKLAKALDKLPNCFPRTQSHIEIAILKKIFSQDEAALANKLSHKMEPVETIAERSGLTNEVAHTRLARMAERGLLWSKEVSGNPHFRLAPFIVGIYEAQLDTMDHELAHLVENYMYEGGAAGIMKP